VRRFAFLVDETATVGGEFAIVGDKIGFVREQFAFVGAGRASMAQRCAIRGGMSRCLHEGVAWLAPGSVPRGERFAFLASGRASRREGIAARETRA
jgi:hypothetical protein